MFVESINQIVACIEKKNKPFEIKCLVSRQEENVLWYLALYSDWLLKKYKTQRERYEMVLKELSPSLTPELVSSFGGVIIFSPGNPMVQYLKDNSVALKAHPFGTWVHTQIEDYPWVIQLRSLKKRKSSPKIALRKKEKRMP